MKPYKSDGGVLQIELPVNSTPVDKPVIPGSLGSWTTWVQKPKAGQGPDIRIEVTWEMAYVRDGLARSGTARWQPGRVEEGSYRRTPDYVEERRVSTEPPINAVLRFYEHDGIVVSVLAYSGSRIYPRIRDHIDAILDTVKILKKPELPAFPLGYGKVAMKGREIWTDVDDKTVKAFLKIHTKGWNAAAKVLDGEPADRTPPRLIVCGRPITYDELAVGDSRMGKGPSAYLQQYLRAVVINADGWKKRRDDAEQTIELAAMTQALRMHFGGVLPDWLEIGLANYVDAGLDAGGKPQKPKKSRIQSGREAFLAADRSLDVVLDVRCKSDATERLAFTHESWTWHFFFRHGAGKKKYGARYADHLKRLHESGDPLEARKAWEGVDFAAMHDDAMAWAAKWR